MNLHWLGSTNRSVGTCGEPIGERGFLLHVGIGFVQQAVPSHRRDEMGLFGRPFGKRPINAMHGIVDDSYGKESSH